MSRYRIRVNDEDEGGPNGLLLLTAGALAGFAAGVYLSQRFGGIAGVTSRLREQFGRHTTSERGAGNGDEYEGEEEDELAEHESFVSANEELEERVLEAFTHDPTLKERAVDIGAVADRTIELTGHVFSTFESEHATTIARGVPGVETVVNRLSVRSDEQDETDETDVEATSNVVLDEHWDDADEPLSDANGPADQGRPSFYETRDRGTEPPPPA